MLQKINRLASKADFDRLFSKGRSAYSGPVTLKFVATSKDFSRFGFVISTKVSKRSTVRNTIRRRLREALRLRFSEIKPGFDGVFMCRPETKTLEYADFVKIVDELLNKTKLLNNKEDVSIKKDPQV